MEEKRFRTAPSPDPSRNTEGLVQPGDERSSADFYSLPQNNYDTDTSLEVREQPHAGNQSSSQPPNSPLLHHNSKGLSRRRAMIVSTVITLVVTMLTGVSILLLSRNSPEDQAISRSDIKTQDVSIKDAVATTVPAELKGGVPSLLVNGDLISRGVVKVTSGAYVSILKPTTLTSNQTYTLPDASGTICLDSGNCNFASSDTLNQTNNAVTALQNRLGQITVPNVPASSLVNNQAGAVAIQGTTNQVSVTNGNGTITLAGPQDLAPISSPTFAGLLLNGNFSLTGILTLPANCSALLNGGALTTDGSGQVICSADDGGGTGGTVSSPGGTAGVLPLFTAAQTIADSIISQALGTITVGGDLATDNIAANGTISATGALSGASLTLTSALAVPSGGTGAVSFTANGLLIGNGVGAITATNAAANGQLLLGNGTTPTFTSITGDITISGAGLTTIQTDSIALGTDTTGNYLSTLSGSNGVSVSGSGSEGATPTVSLAIQASKGLEVDANGLSLIDCLSGEILKYNGSNQWVCSPDSDTTGSFTAAGSSGTPQTIGNGDTLTIAAGDNITTTAGATDTVTIATVQNPTFTTSVTTPLLQSSGALSITPNGALTVGATSQTALLQGSSATITSNGAGNDIVLTSADQIRLTGFNCTTFTNGGVLTTDASGNISCGNDDGGAAGAVTGSGTTNRVALFTGAQTVADSWLLQNGSTLEIDNTRNLSLTGGNFSVTGTGTFSGLLTANGSLTIEAGDTFTFNGDAFTDLTGTGLQISTGSLQTTLGTSVDLASAEVTGILPVASGGTGVNGSSAANGTLLVGNGTGYTLATLTQGSGITITNGAGSITVASTLGTTIESGEITDLTVTGGDIANDTIALGTKTTGNYVATIAGSSQIDVTGSGSETAAITLGIIADSIGDGQLAFNTGQNLTTTSSPTFASLILDDGTANEGTLVIATLTADRTYTFPDDDGEVCLVEAGNCAGSGDGITGSGTQNAISKFGAGGDNIVDSTLSDDGTNVTTSVDLIIQGGAATLGTTGQAGSIVINDGSTNTATIVLAAHGGNYTYTIPDAGGADEFCIKALGNCAGAGGGNAPNSAQYLTLALDGGLTSERTLSFNGTNFSVSDGGANGAYSVNTIQNIATGSAPSFAGLTLTGNLSLGTNTVQGTTAVIDFTNFDVASNGNVTAGTFNAQTISATASLTGTLAVAGLTTLNGGLTIETGDTFTVNGDGFTDLTGNGLQVSTGVLAVAVQANKGLEVDANGLSLIDCSDGQVLKYNGANQWVCAADGTGTDGDSLSVNSTAATDANFLDTAATGTATATSWSLNAVSNPDDITLAIGNASATEAGAVTTGAQTFAGAKTFNGSIIAGAGVNLGAQTLQGTTAVIDFNNFDVSSAGAITAVGVNAGAGLLQGTGGLTVSGTVTLSSLTNGFLEVNGAGVVSVGTIDLGTDTAGNYVATITSGNGISAAATGEGSTPTVALANLTADWLQSGAFDITLDNSASELKILESGLTPTFYAIFDTADIAADQTFMLNEGGTVVTSGNVATYATTGVAAGTGLTGGGTVGALTLNVVSANGGIVVNANDIALTIQANKGLEVDANGLSLIDCADTQILKYNGSNQWVCAADIDTDTGDEVAVNGASTSGANFLDTAASGTVASTSWSLNAVSNPDDITLVIGTASATEAGIVNTSAQTFAGAKTFNGSIIAGAGVNLGTQTLQGTTAVIDFTNFDVSSAGAITAVGVNAGSGLLQGTGGITVGGTVTLSSLTNGFLEANGSGVVSIGTIDLGTDTAGNYVATITSGNGISATATGEGSTPTVALSDLTADWLQSGAFDITLDNSASELKIRESTGAFYAIFDVSDLASDQTFTYSEGGTVVTSTNVGTYATTAVAAGTGLTGGGTVGALTLNVASGNGGIVANANDITLTIQANKGLEVDASGLSLIDCATDQVLKYNAFNQWVCAADGTGADGDSVSVNSTAATDLNFLDTAASGTVASTSWSLNAVSNPDDITLVVGAASATEAGIVNVNAQTFAGAKTFNGQIIAGAGVNLGTQTLQGTTAVIDFTNFDVASSGAITAVGVNAGTGLLQGTGGITVGGTVTLSSLTNGFLEANGSGVVSVGTIDLGTDTAGNYVATITSGNGISAAATGEGSTPTVALSNLTADWLQSGAFDITLDNSASELKIRESTGSFYAIFDVSDLASDQTFTYSEGGTVVTSTNVGTYATTAVTAGSGLTGGGTVGALTLNVASGNGGIVANANDITLTIQANKGLEVDVNGLSLIDCALNEILKYNGSNQWACAADAGGSGTGDNVSVNGVAADNANFLDTAATGTSTATTWSINAVSNPDDITVVIGNASATEAGAVTTGAQTFAGAKTFNGQIVAGAGIDLAAQTLQGTTAVIDFTNFDVSSAGNVTAAGTLTIQGASATVGAAAVQGSLILNDGSTNTGTIQTAALGQNTIYTLIDPGTGSVDICLSTGNCAGAGSGVTESGTNVSGQVAYFTSDDNLTSDADFLFDGTNVDVGGTLFVGTANAFQVAANGNVTSGTINGQTISATASFTGSVAVATTLSVTGNITVGANSTINLTGGTTASRPGSPTEGMVYFDTDTDKLLVYSNGKWQADRTTATKIVAASNSSQQVKDSADYVADGTGDQTEINAALTAAAGGKVYLAEGTYVANATILIPNNTTLAGAGQGTLIELADLDADENLIENTDQTTGTGITIQDLKLDGRKDLNTAGAQFGILLNDMGDATANRVGAKLTNLWVGNTRNYGILIESSDNNTFSGNTLSGNDEYGVYLFSSSNNTLAGNGFNSNAVAGLFVENGSGNSIVNNIAKGNSSGFYLFTASSSTLTGNVATGNTGIGFNIYATTNTTFTGNVALSNGGSGFALEGGSGNTVSANNAHNSGGGATNDGIHLNGSDSNTITGNTITDTFCTTNCYAINISNNTSDTNYLADNRYSTANGTATINDAGTGTIYGGQLDGSNNFLINPSGTIELQSNTNVTGNFTASGTGLFSGASVTVGAAALQGSLVLNDGNGGQTATIQSGNIAANTVISIPGSVGATDTFCLATLANCAGGATTTLQQAYGNDADGSDTIIALTAADDSLIFRNSASGSDSEYVLTVDQQDTGASKGGLLVVNGGGASSYSFRVNDDGTISDSTPFVIDNIGNVTIGSSGGAGSLNIIKNFTNVNDNATSLYVSSTNSGNINDTSTYTTYGLNLDQRYSGTLTSSELNLYGTSSNGWFSGALGAGTSEILNVTGGAFYADFTGGTPSAGDTVTLRAITALTATNLGTTGATSMYGVDVNVQGTADTNYGLNVNVGGATTNYAAILLGGNVGIGDTTPAALLTVGNGDLFQVNSSGDITTAAAENLSITTGTTGSLTLDTGTTGAINIGTSANNKTITIGNTNGNTNLALQAGAGGGTLTIGASGSIQQVTVGSANATSSLVLQSGTGDVAINSQDDINIGTSANAQDITIGNSTGASSVSINCGTGTCGFGNNAIAHSTIVGSVTGAAATTLQAGSGGIVLSAATTTATGNLLVQGGITTGVSSATDGSVSFLNGTNGFSVALAAGSQTVGSANISFPDTLGVSDTLCLRTLANCTGSGSGATLQAAYNADVDGSDAVIALTSADGAVLIRDNATPLGTTLFAVQNSGGGTNYLNVTTAGITTSGDLAVNGGDITSTVALNISAGGGFDATLRAGSDPSGSGGDLNLFAGDGDLGNPGVAGNVSIQAGSDDGYGDISIGTSGVGTVQIGPTSNLLGATIAIGNNAAGPTTLTLGSSFGTSVTTLQSGSGGIIIPASLGGTINTSTYLCRNSSNQLTTCLTTGTGAAFVQGGNDFGANAILGTNGAGQTLALETAGTTRVILDASGNLAFQQATTLSTTTGNLTVQANGANTLTLNTTGAGTINLGTTNTGTIGIGNSTAGTTVAINGGTGASAVTIQAGAGGTIGIGSSGVANTIQIGNTTGAVAQTINLGNNATASSTTNVTLGNLLSTSSTVIQGGTGSSAVSIQSGASGTISIGTSPVNKTVTIGSTSGAVTEQINIGRSNNVGSSTSVYIGPSNGTGSGSTIIQAGTGGVSIGDTSSVNNTIQIGSTVGAVAQTINLGNNATASSTSTVTIGSTIGTSAVTIQSGTGDVAIQSQDDINIGTNAVAQDIVIGNGTGATSVNVNCGTGACNFGTNGSVHATTVGSTTTGSTTIIQGGNSINLSTTVNNSTITIGADQLNKTIQLGTTLNTGTDTINIGVNATASSLTNVTIGSSIAASSLVLRSGTGDVAIQSQDDINIGTNTAAQDIVIGNSTGTTSVTVNCGTGACSFGANAIAHTTTLGSITGAATTTLQSGTGGLTLQTLTTGAINIDSGTTGAINIGTSATNFKTITIGSLNGATGALILRAGQADIALESLDDINIGTNAVAQDITIGNATGATSVSIQSGTGPISIGTGAQARTLNFGTGAAVQTVTLGSATTTSSLLLQSGTGDVAIQSQDDINIGTNAVAQDITIGNQTGATNVSIVSGGSGSIGIGNTAGTFSTIYIGSVFGGGASSIMLGSPTAASTTTIQAGTGGIAIGNNGVANTVQIGNTTGAVSQTINIGNNATASSSTTLNVGSSIGSSPTIVQAGTGGLFIGTSTVARSILIGNATGASSLSLDAGTGGTSVNTTAGGAISIGTNAAARSINIGTGAAAQTVTVGSTNTTSSLALQAGSGGVNVTSGTLNVGVASSTTGSFNLFNSGSAFTTTIQTAVATVANRTLTIPNTAGVADTFCLLTLANCSGTATTLQQSYTADVDGSDAVIALSAADGGVIIRDNATPLGSTLFAVQNSTGTSSYLGVTVTGVTVAGTISVPGSGTNSERFGAGTTAGGNNSLAVGNGASVATANESVAIGNSASVTGTALDGGAVALGYQATAATSLNGGGIAIGRQSSAGASSNAGSIAIGREATSTDNSVSMGFSADSTGKSVALGSSTTASASASDSYAIALGYGSVASTASGNATVIALGPNANASFDKSIAIGYGATTTAVNQLVVGSSNLSHAITEAYFGNGVTATSPSAFTLNATGGSGSNISGANLLFASGRGTGTGVGGNIVFQYAPAGAAGASLNALQTACSISGTNGSLSCPTIGGSANERFGNNALISVTTGLQNSAFGNGALQANQGGNYNSAFGYGALGSNTSGNENVAIGRQALVSNSTGLQNVGIGYHALTNANAQGNTGIGYQVLASTSSGTNNTALGLNAGFTNTSGSSNTYIGSFAGNHDTIFSTPNNLSNATAIGASSVVQASNSLVLGGAGAQAVNVGIGTTIPTNTLSVSPTQYSTGTAGTGGVSSTTVTGSGTTWTTAMIGSELIFSNGTKATITAFGSTTSLTVTPAITVANGTQYRIHFPGLQVTSSGNVGIGINNPVNYKLFVKQSAQGSSRGLRIEDPGTAVGLNLYVDSGGNQRLGFEDNFTVGNDSAITKSGTLQAGRELTIKTFNESVLGAIKFDVNGTEIARFANNGNFSIDDADASGDPTLFVDAVNNEAIFGASACTLSTAVCITATGVDFHHNAGNVSSKFTQGGNDQLILSTGSAPNFGGLRIQGITGGSSANLALRANTGQTSNLFEAQNTSGVALLSIDTAANLVFEGTADAFETTITVANAAADRTYTIPDSTGNATDTFCLLTLANCSGSATTLQASYTADVDGSDAVIALTSADGGVIIRDNATPLGSTLFAVQNSAGTSSYLGVTATGVTVAGTISVPGAGSNSERFGAGATASGSGSTAIGNSASTANNQSLAIGASASAVCDQTIAIGVSASTGNCVGADGTIAIGAFSSGTRAGIAIGKSASSFDYSIALGSTANAAHGSSIVLGEAATSTAVNQFVVKGVTTGYFGNGVTAAAPSNFTLQGTGGSAIGVAGASFTLAGGAGTTTTTGSAGGNLTLQGGNAGGSGNNDGGDVFLAGGTATGSGVRGDVILQQTTGSVGIGTGVLGPSQATLHIASESATTTAIEGLSSASTSATLHGRGFGSGSLQFKGNSVSGDRLFQILGSGWNNVGSDSYYNAATIDIAVDGTPGENDMPGRIVFSTSADGSSIPTERLRIDSTGNVGIGDTSPDARLDVELASTSTTAATERGSQVTVSDTGIVTTGTDTTIGQEVVVVRTGATGGSINTIGLDIQGTADTGGAATTVLTGININVTGADTNYAALFNGGNVGIGTALPTAKLFIDGTQDNQQLVVQANASQTANLIEFQANGGAKLAYVTGAGQMIFGTDANCGSVGTQVCIDNTGVEFRTGGGNISSKFTQASNDALVLGVGAGSSNYLGLRIENTTNATATNLAVRAATGQTGNLFEAQSTAAAILLKINTGGNLLAGGASTATTGTTEATARTDVTTVTLTAAGAFANNDVIFINNAGQDYYTRIVSGGGTTTLTVSPAVSYDVSAPVTKYTVQNIGATATDYTTQADRFFQGYFLGGVVTGAGSTTLSDGNLSSTGVLTVQRSGGATRFGGDVIQVGNGVNALGDSGSMVPNPGFEINIDGDQTVADGWGFTQVTGAPTADVRTTSPFQGERSQQITATTTQEGSVYSSCVPVTVVNEYNVIVKHAATVTATSAVTLSLSTYTSKEDCVDRTSGTVIIVASGAATSSSSYTQTGGLATTSNTARWARVAVSLLTPSNNTTVTFDSVRMSPSDNTEGIDLAENFPALASDNLLPGEIVAFGGAAPEGGSYVVRSASVADGKVFGVVSTQPGLTLDDGGAYEKVTVALAGRVPVKVSDENGAIAVGDPITASSIPGVGMKANAASKIIGTAVTAYDGTGVGTTVVLIAPEFWVPALGETLQTDNAIFGSLQITGTANIANLNVSGAATLATLTVTGDAIIEGTLTVTKLVVKETITVEGLIYSSGNKPTAEKNANLGADNGVLAATVEIDGTDTAGTLTMVAGENPLSGVLAKILFTKTYEKAPRIVISAINEDGLSMPVFARKVDGGFEIVTNTIPQAGKTYQFDYIIIGSEGVTP